MNTTIDVGLAIRGKMSYLLIDLLCSRREGSPAQIIFCHQQGIAAKGANAILS
jgi:hypothetical protein